MIRQGAAVVPPHDRTGTSAMKLGSVRTRANAEFCAILLRAIGTEITDGGRFLVLGILKIVAL
jgi:hypothetical protein